MEPTQYANRADYPAAHIALLESFRVTFPMHHDQFAQTVQDTKVDVEKRMETEALGSLRERQTTTNPFSLTQPLNDDLLGFSSDALRPDLNDLLEFARLSASLTNNIAIDTVVASTATFLDKLCDISTLSVNQGVQTEIAVTNQGVQTVNSVTEHSVQIDLQPPDTAISRVDEIIPQSTNYPLPEHDPSDRTTQLAEDAVIVLPLAPLIDTSVAQSRPLSLPQTQPSSHVDHTSSTPAPAPAKRRGRPKKRTGSESNIDIVLFIGFDEAGNSLYQPIESATERIQAFLRNTFDAMYCNTKKDKSAYENMVSVDSKEHSLLKEQCVNMRLFARRYKLDSDCIFASSFCCRTRRLCARIFFDGHSHKLCIFPQERSPGLTWGQEEFWLAT